MGGFFAPLERGVLKGVYSEVEASFLAPIK